eukprot:3191915-Amphidinium_carterae.2
MRGCLISADHNTSEVAGEGQSLKLLYALVVVLTHVVPSEWRHMVVGEEPRYVLLTCNLLHPVCPKHLT